MAVIIKDMEKLPDSCFNCDLHNYHFCDLTGNLIEENWGNGTRADDCPLSEVSDVINKEIEYCKYCKNRTSPRNGVICRHCYVEPNMYEYDEDAEEGTINDSTRVSETRN